MLRTVEAVIDEQGNVRLLEAVHLSAARRALVTILEDESTSGISETALLSEQALARIGSAPRKKPHGHTCSRRGNFAVVLVSCLLYLAKGLSCHPERSEGSAY